MISCFCNRLYNVSRPSTITEYAFSGSLCRIREYETADGLRYCLTIFSLSDYKHLHFQHDEYKYLNSKLYALLLTQAIIPSASTLGVQKANEHMWSIHLPMENLKLNLEYKA